MEGKYNLDMLSNVNDFLELFPNQTRTDYFLWERWAESWIANGVSPGIVKSEITECTYLQEHVDGMTILFQGDSITSLFRIPIINHHTVAVHPTCPEIKGCSDDLLAF
jgi:hypothetical protein